MKKLFPISVMLAAASPVQAADSWLYSALGSPENWRISGSVRTRIEAIDGQFRPAGPNSDRLLALRTTLFAEYSPGPVHVGAELFDSRGYLQAPNSTVGTGDINALELAQAYVAVDFGSVLGAGTQSRVQAGRFTMDLGSRRLVSRQLFRNTTNAYTGVRLDWSGKDRDHLTLFWTMPQFRLPNDAAGIRANAVVFDRESTSLQLFGGIYARPHLLGGTLEVYGYGLIERDDPGFQTANRRLFTPGFRLFRSPKPGQADFDLEFALQRGTARANTLPGSTRDLPVSAWFLHAEYGIGLAARWSPRIALVFDYASGDGPDPNSLNRFDTLYGSRRSDFGPTGIYGALARANLISPALRVEVTPSRRVDAMVAWRPLWLASASDSFGGTGTRDPAGASGRFAGHQIEWRARYWIKPGVLRLEAGGALLAKSGFLRDAPNARANGDTRYGYCDLSLSI